MAEWLWTDHERDQGANNCLILNDSRSTMSIIAPAGLVNPRSRASPVDGHASGVTILPSKEFDAKVATDLGNVRGTFGH